VVASSPEPCAGATDNDTHITFTWAEWSRWSPAFLSPQISHLSLPAGVRRTIPAAIRAAPSAETTEIIRSVHHRSMTRARSGSTLVGK
jgi:hypothetical protein